VVRALPRTFEREAVVAPATVLLRATVVRLRRAVGLDLRLAEEFKVRLAINLIPPGAALQQLPYQPAMGTWKMGKICREAVKKSSHGVFPKTAISATLQLSFIPNLTQ
jgi:hypothetical protein